MMSWDDEAFKENIIFINPLYINNKLSNCSALFGTHLCSCLNISVVILEVMANIVYFIKINTILWPLYL